MSAFANPRLFLLSPAFHVLVLLFFWCAGLFFGYSIYEPSFSSLMHSSAEAPMSIIGVFVCTYLPLIFTYFSAITNKPVIILLVCFLKAAALGFSGMLVYDYFSSAAWLIRFLFLFSDILVSIILLLMWMRYFSSNHFNLSEKIHLFVILSTAISIVDQFVIHPLLVGLL